MVLVDGPGSVFWRVDFVIKVDWARLRRSDGVDFGQFPLPSAPTDAEISGLITLEINPAQRLETPYIVSLDAVAQAFCECRSHMRIDACYMGFTPEDGRLRVSAVEALGAAGPEQTCMFSSVFLDTGDLNRCVPGACFDE